MTVRLVETIQNFQCLSSDEKPAPAGVPEGAKLHIVDTGEQYVAYNGSWEIDLRLIYALSVV